MIRVRSRFETTKIIKGINKLIRIKGKHKFIYVHVWIYFEFDLSREHYHQLRNRDDEFVERWRLLYENAPRELLPVSCAHASRSPVPSTWTSCSWYIICDKLNDNVRFRRETVVRRVAPILRDPVTGDTAVSNAKGKSTIRRSARRLG